MSPWQVGAFTGGSAFAAKAPRAASVRMVTKGARKNVIMMSAATDEIIEKLKTLTVRALAAEYALRLPCASRVDLVSPELRTRRLTKVGN